MMELIGTPPVGKIDFRKKVARDRREKMRARLLAATLEVYQSESANGSAVIDDVVRSAGVARGTFYKYFNTLEEAVSELGSQMSIEMLGTIELIFRDRPDPAERVAGGIMMPLARAAMQPGWAIFASRVDYTHPSRAHLLRGFTEVSLLEAKEREILCFPDLASAIDLMVGTSLEAMRRSANRLGLSEGHIVTLTTMILMGLGASAAAAAQAAQSAWARLAAHAPALAWWGRFPYR